MVEGKRRDIESRIARYNYVRHVSDSYGRIIGVKEVHGGLV